MLLLRSVFAAGLAAGTLFHVANMQTPVPPAASEVASLRLSALGGDGQLTVSPPNALTFTAHRVTLTVLVQIACGVNNELYIDRHRWRI